MITPLFHTNDCLSSLITINEPGKAKKGAADSIFDIAVENKWTELYIADDYFTSFMGLYRICQKLNIKLRYGIRMIFVDSVSNQEPDSIKTEARYIIWAKTGKGIKLLQKLYSECATEHLYSHKEYNNSKKYKRCDFGVLKRYWDNELLALMPTFYDGFIYNNLLKGHYHIPDFSFCKPILEVQSNGLPVDELISEKVTKYAQDNSFNLIKTKSIYYKNKIDVKAFQVYKSILNRRTFEKPELEGFGSNEFCIESILEKNKQL